MTDMVNLIDERESGREHLHTGVHVETMHDDEKMRDVRQGTFSVFLLSPRTFFPQNHTDVISGGDERAPLHPLAGTSEVS